MLQHLVKRITNKHLKVQLDFARLGKKKFNLNTSKIFKLLHFNSIKQCVLDLNHDKVSWQQPFLLKKFWFQSKPTQSLSKTSNFWMTEYQFTKLSFFHFTKYLNMKEVNHLVKCIINTLEDCLFEGVISNGLGIPFENFYQSQNDFVSNNVLTMFQ